MASIEIKNVVVDELRETGCWDPKPLISRLAARAEGFDPVDIRRAIWELISENRIELTSNQQLKVYIT